jgi:hypothetical protein
MQERGVCLRCRRFRVRPWLDLGLLVRKLLPNDTVQEVHYFTAGISSRPYNPTSAHDQGLYIRALKTVPNLHMKYRHFLTHSVPMYLTCTSCGRMHETQYGVHEAGSEKFSWRHCAVPWALLGFLGAIKSCDCMAAGQGKWRPCSDGERRTQPFLLSATPPIRPLWAPYTPCEMGKSGTTSAKTFTTFFMNLRMALVLKSKQHPDPRRSYVRECVFHWLFTASPSTQDDLSSPEAPLELQLHWGSVIPSAKIYGLFAAQSPRPPMPLSTLQETPHDVPCKTRGQDGFATSFPVE